MRVGLDIGSRMVKVVLAGEDSRSERLCMPTAEFYQRAVAREGEGLRLRPEALGVPADAQVAATGYGRNAAGLAGARIINELLAHARGAAEQTGEQSFVLVDFGGQDTKAMSVREGRIVDFSTNDRCGASSGRFVENMAAVLGVTLQELGETAAEPIVLSSTCGIFAETEIIGLLAAGVPREELCAGVLLAVVRRTLPLLIRMPPGRILLSGGLALLPRLAHLLARESGREVTPLPDPLYNGAIGCCSFASSQA